MRLTRDLRGSLTVAAVAAAVALAFTGASAGAAPKAKIFSDCGQENASTGALDKVQKAIDGLGTPAAVARTVDV